MSESIKAGVSVIVVDGVKGVNVWQPFERVHKTGNAKKTGKPYDFYCVIAGLFKKQVSINGKTCEINFSITEKEEVEVLDIG